MVTCPSCSHQNPDHATHCEACYIPLPVAAPAAIAEVSPEAKTQEMTSCPNCKAEVIVGASFCGNCGLDLRSVPHISLELPQSIAPQLIAPDSIPPLPPVAAQIGALPEPEINLAENNKPPEPITASGKNKTQLQQISAHLFHVQTESKIEIPPSLLIVHIGKPNNLIPPDIDLSGFPDSDIVSRVHGDIRNEGDAYYFEDTGSSNGTYINNVPLPPGNRHRLRAGDRIAMGKGDKVSFIFQTTS